MREGRLGSEELLNLVRLFGDGQNSRDVVPGSYRQKTQSTLAKSLSESKSEVLATHQSCIPRVHPPTPFPELSPSTSGNTVSKPSFALSFHPVGWIPIPPMSSHPSPF